MRKVDAGAELGMKYLFSQNEMKREVNILSAWQVDTFAGLVAPQAMIP